METVENVMNDIPKNCSECEHYDGTCLLVPKEWESWRLMERRRPVWCPLPNVSTVK